MSVDTTKSAAAFWDTVGKAYETAFKDVPGQQRSLQWLLDNLPKNSQAADIGCGTGRPVCETLVKAGHTVTGIDVSPVMLSIAREQVPQATFVESSAFDWKPESPLNAVTAYFSLISNLTRDQIRSYFPLAYSWLRPGGLFVLATEPVDGELVTAKWMGRDAVGSGISVEEMLEKVKDAGFELVKVERENFQPNGVGSGLCAEGEDREEDHIFIWARRPE